MKERIKIKNNLYFKFKETKCQEDGLKYQAYRKVLDIDINIYRKNYFKYRLDNRWNSIKNIWKTLNDITSYNNKNKNSVIDHITTQNGIIHNKSDIANEFNNYFVNIGNNLASMIPNKEMEFREFLPEGLSNSIF